MTNASLPSSLRSRPTLRPGDDGYEAARRVFNGMIDRRPAVIERCASSEDVVDALQHARSSELEVAVKAGGHSAAGFSMIDDGLVIDLSAMCNIDVDPVRRTVRVGGGATWGQLDEATQRCGLAVTGGRVSSTGVAGFTLGSGSGWLERKLGLAADNLVSAQVVLADGSVVRASATEKPDLFWGLRGGGGNFGIVTEFEFALHPIGPIVLGGMLLYPFDDAAGVIRDYRGWIESCPDDMCGGLALLTAPPAPFIPAELQDHHAVGIIVLHAGHVEDGAKLVDRFRARRPPSVDLVEPMPYTAVQTLLDEANPPGSRDYFKAGFLDELTDDAVDIFVRSAASAPSPLTSLILQPLGGAVARIGDMDTALGHRQAKWAYQALSLWSEPDDDVANIDWTRGTAAALADHARPAGFPNFIADAGPEAVRQTYGEERYAKLAEIKRRYDPDNLFRHNHNIAPATGWHAR